MKKTRVKVFESGATYAELNDNLKTSSDENRKQYYVRDELLSLSQKRLRISWALNID